MVENEFTLPNLKRKRKRILHQTKNGRNLFFYWWLWHSAEFFDASYPQALSLWWRCSFAKKAQSVSLKNVQLSSFNFNVEGDGGKQRLKHNKLVMLTSPLQQKIPALQTDMLQFGLKSKGATLSFPLFYLLLPKSCNQNHYFKCSTLTYH